MKLNEDEAMDRKHDEQVRDEKKAVEKDLERMERNFGNAGNY